MYPTLVVFALLAVSSIHSLEVEDIFPPELIAQAQLAKTHEDFGLDIYQFLAKYGYPVETHEVTTEDGYILTMQRVPHGRNEDNTTNTKKPAVLVMHGLLCSAMDMVNTGPEKSLALNLADAGYDVWLGNNRGTTWSRKHVTLDPDTDKKDFWDYSFDELGNYDLPAKIDYILSTTGNEKVNYVGHSQGTTQFFAMGALRPEYNDKIQLMIALAPVGYMTDMTQPLARFAANYTTLIETISNQVGIHELLPHMPVLTHVIQIVCNDDSKFQQICLDLIFYLAGGDADQFDPSFFVVIGSNTPAGISMKMLLHYMQEVHSGYFRRYDHGLNNLAIYKKLTPPVYDISLITSPIALYYGKNDLFAAVSDVERLAAELPNVVKQNLMEYELFSHVDFIWARDLKTMLNDDAVALMNTYNSIAYIYMIC